ncbi:acid phosphatase [Klebsiella pneumoniae]|nr:Major phosphate-irrepressible acid phosphatase [Klebsiella pneumoniae]CAH6112546.1 Major phosphate-irrepressible acid phosphatase [Klebsiella pneumoniae]SXB59309.1 acid phosphatase [Klebsiella pneumoniae]SYU49895.1 acid phosphatase [Klebsiella pneumoniae]VAP41819.1 acid phosphatase [Klebsiella pneumoniae]
MRRLARLVRATWGCRPGQTHAATRHRCGSEPAAWQSDVDAARIVGSAVVATLHTNPAFQQQLQKAKDEFAKRQK